MSEYPRASREARVASIRANLDRWRARCEEFRSDIDGRRKRLAVLERRVRTLGPMLDRLTIRRIETPVEILYSPGDVNPAAEDVQATRDAAVDLLRRAGKPLHYRAEIYPALARLPLNLTGRDPAQTLNHRLADDPRLHQPSPGTYALRPPNPPATR